MSPLPIYQPTPLEEAYAIYLLQQVFHIANSSTNLRIKGRDAVPFLSQSGINRLVLRNIWTVADPQNVGTLTQITQFHLILRLTALAQEGSLLESLNNAYQTHVLTPVQAMTRCLQETNSKTIPLPVFSNIQVPSGDYLQQIYYQCHQTAGTIPSQPQSTHQQSFQQASSQGFQQQPQPLTSIEDAFGGLVDVQDAPLPTLSSSETPNEFTTTTGPSSFADFSSNSQQTNMPLERPRSQSGDGAMQQQSPVFVGTSTTTRSLESLSQQQPSLASHDGHSANVSTIGSVPSTMSHLSVTEAFGGGLVDVVHNDKKPLPSLEHKEQAVVSDVEDDEFGDFTAPKLPMEEQSSKDKQVDDFGAFEGTTRAPNQPDSFALQQTKGDSQPAPEASGWDAFDALTPVQDAPLPSLDQSKPAAEDDSGGLEGTTAQTTQEVDEFGDFAGKPPLETPPQQTVEDDDFGDFAGTETAQERPADNDAFADTPKKPFETDLEPHATQDDEEFGDFAGTETAPQAFEDDGAFGDFAGTATEATGRQDVNTSHMQGSVQFGLYGALDSAAVGQSATPAEPAGWDALDALAETQDAPLPDLASYAMKSETAPALSPTHSAEAEDDDFGDFAGTTGPAEAIMGPSSEEKEFGEFEGTPPEVAVNQDVGTEPNGSHGTLGNDAPASSQEPVGWDALDGLGATEDAPLPDLASYSAQQPSKAAPAVSLKHSEASQDEEFGDFAGTAMPVEETTEQPNAEDDFGDFEGTPHDTAASFDIGAGTHQSSEDPSGWNVLDALGETQNAPLPDPASYPIEQATKKVSSHIDADHAEFGDFEGTTAPAEDIDEHSVDEFQTDKAFSAGIAVPAEASGWDALDALAEPQNAPLPDLATYSYDSTDGKVSDDAKTGHSDIREEMQSATASVDGTHEDEDFGNFSGVEVRTKEDGTDVERGAPRTPLSGDDDFGDFVGSETQMSKESAATASRSQSVEFAGNTMSSPDESTGSPQSRSIPSSKNPSKVERSDSAYYSAHAQSMSTTFDDMTEFQDAVQDIGEQSEKGASSASSPTSQGQDAGSVNASCTATERAAGVGDDPFSAFDALAAPQGEVPPLSTQGTPTTMADGSVPSSDEPYAAIAAPSTDSDFVALNGAQPVHVAKETPIEETQTLEDDFGDFAGLQMTGPTLEERRNEKDVAAEDDFGLFSSFEGSSVSRPTVPKEEFDADPESPAVVQNAPGDDFGAFADSAPENETQGNAGGCESDAISPISEHQSNASTAENEVTDSFGSFEGVVSVQNEIDTIQAGPVAAEKAISTMDEEDDFGDFASFGDFGSTPPVPEAAIGPPAAQGDVDGFSAFREPATEEARVDPERQNLLLVREAIVNQSRQLPEALRRQSNGEPVDFGDCFEANIGLEVPVTEDRKTRAQKCLQILSLLTSSHTKLASTYWAQALGVARDELATGSLLLQEAATLSPEEMDDVRVPLQTFVYGLGEFVRVARYIVATIGDLLLLDSSALLTIDTFASSWRSIPLLKDILEVEKLWKDMEELCKTVGLVSKQDSDYKLESLVEIRTAKVKSSSNRLCQFTLQPLQNEEQTTKSPVDWEGRPFMACAANLLANKCAFYAVNA